MQEYKTSIIAFLFLLSFFGCKKKSETNSPIATAQNQALVTVDNLRVRELPDVSSKILHSLSKGDMVGVIKRDPQILVINGISGSWWYIASEKGAGWAFDAFLNDKFITPEELLSQARSLEASNIPLAIEKYEYIIREFPRASNLAGGSISSIAKGRISVLNCLKNHPSEHIASKAQLMNEIRESLERKNLNTLKSIADCEFSAGICHSDAWGPDHSDSLFNLILSQSSDFDWNNPQNEENSQSILIKSISGDNSFGFGFADAYNGSFRWISYCSRK